MVIVREKSIGVTEKWKENRKSKDMGKFSGVKGEIWGRWMLKAKT